MGSKSIRMKTTIRLDSDKCEDYRGTVDSDKSWSFEIYMP